MEVFRYFGNAKNGYKLIKRDIPASFQEQRDFCLWGDIPSQASPDDIQFLMEGLCETPEIILAMSKQRLKNYLLE